MISRLKAVQNREHQVIWYVFELRSAVVEPRMNRKGEWSCGAARCSWFWGGVINRPGKLSPCGGDQRIGFQFCAFVRDASRVWPALDRDDFHAVRSGSS